jgi:hypothetical protein
MSPALTCKLNLMFDMLQAACPGAAGTSLSATLRLCRAASPLLSSQLSITNGIHLARPWTNSIQMKVCNVSIILLSAGEALAKAGH